MSAEFYDVGIVLYQNRMKVSVKTHTFNSSTWEMRQEDRESMVTEAVQQVSGPTLC